MQWVRHSKLVSTRAFLIDCESSNSKVLREDAFWLERPFEEEDVSGVVRGLNGDKALGLDGFSLAFYQVCWDVIKEDVLSVFNEFARHEMFVRNLNTSFIVLIP